MKVVIHRGMVVVATAFFFFCISAGTSLADSFALGTGTLDVFATLGDRITVTGTGSLAVHAAADGVVGGAADFRGSLDRLFNRGVPTITTIPIGPLAGSYSGQGILNATSLPNEHEGIGTMRVNFDNTDSDGLASWESIVIGDDIRMRYFTFVEVERSDSLAPHGTGLGHSFGTTFFRPDFSTSLELRVEVSSVRLVASADPGELSAAQIHATGAFGRGAVPGMNVLASWDFFEQVTNDDAFVLRQRFLLDRTFRLQAGETYWLTANLSTVADGIPAPEPSTLSLLGLGTLGLLGYGWRRRKQPA